MTNKEAKKLSEIGFAYLTTVSKNQSNKLDRDDINDMTQDCIEVILSRFDNLETFKHKEKVFIKSMRFKLGNMRDKRYLKSRAEMLPIDDAKKNPDTQDHSGILWSDIRKYAPHKTELDMIRSGYSIGEIARISGLSHESIRLRHKKNQKAINNAIK